MRRAIGAAMACFEEALDYAQNRVMFDKVIGGFQLQQKKLAEMITEITKAQLLALQVGRLKDQNKAQHYHISMAKMNNVEIALDAARTARDIAGAAVGVARFHGDVACSMSRSRKPSCHR